jgi:prepilin-type N-terminal cleavage/methylation domain-containing protein
VGDRTTSQPAPRGEAGFTLVELLVAMGLLVVVMLAAMAVLDGSGQTATRDGQRAHAIREAQVGIDQMVRELRHTRVVHAHGAQVLDVTVVRRGVEQRVVFDCSIAHPDRPGTRRCTRTGGGSSRLLVDGVRDLGGDSSAFAYTPSSGPVRHVRIRLAVAADGGHGSGYTHDLVLTSGTALRNVS